MIIIIIIITIAIILCYERRRFQVSEPCRKRSLYRLAVEAVTRSSRRQRIIIAVQA